MTKFIRQNFILIAILIIALFFYTFRLHQTFIMASDTARDLIRVLEIWQKKEITMIGPPLSIAINNPVEVYFGSMHYYFGIIGLIFSNFNPIGSVYINIVLTLLSIPFFFLLSKKFLVQKQLVIISTIIYALSPVTLDLVRQYWNPNLIVPLSVFAWYALLYKKSFKSYFIAGLISGVIFNLHYVNIIPIGIYILFSLFNKDKKYITSFLVGLLITMSPLIAFEIKNKFFLINAFISNLGGFTTFSNRTLNPLFSMDTFLNIFGLGYTDFYSLNLISIDFKIRILIDTVIGVIFLFFLIKKQKIFNFELIGVILSGLLVGWYFESNYLIRMRYFFSIYPLLIIIFVSFLAYLHKFLLIFLLAPLLILSWKMVTHKLDPAREYYPLDTVETISNTIISDNPTGKYNVTENILGDARSLAFRYYLMKDAKIKPQSVEEYSELDSLYVITPSLEKTNKEDRWEFTASGPKNIAWEKNFGDLKLYKFTK